MSDVVNNSNIDCQIQGNTISPSPSVPAIYVVLNYMGKILTHLILVFCKGKKVLK